MARHRSNPRGGLLGAALLATFVVAAGTQGYKQLVVNDGVMKRAEKTNRFIITRIEGARRGAIYSADGRVLAQSNDTFELSLNYRKVPHSQSFFLALSEASAIPAAELAAAAFTGGTARIWRQSISASKAEEIQNVKTTWRADGISLRRVPHRDYPFSDVADLLVGKLEEDKAPTGLENSQEGILGGRPGKQVGLVDRTGAYLTMRMKAEDERAVHGQDLTLTVDTTLQIAAVASLRRAVETENADQGVAVVMDPKTGDVLAAASWINGGGDQSTNGFNPVTMARFEPGSTFKILTLATAMEHGVVRGSDTVQCVGQITVAGKSMKCAHGAHGSVNGTKAIAASCNVSAVVWARKVGHEKFIDFMTEAGLFNKTEIGLPGEISGLYNKNDGSPPLQLANMGFGQALNVTPIGITSAFAALGNGGLRMKPRLIARVGTEEKPVKTAGKLFSEEVATEMMLMMESTIQADFGTAKGLQIPGYRLAGKTGTAQKLGRNSSKGRRQYVSNFVGYVPAENPRAVILVMVDDPKRGNYYGGTVAGPVFKDIAEAVIRRFNIPKSE